MRVVLDIETNGLINPTEVWVIVCKDIDKGEYHVFRNVTSDEAERKRFLCFASGVVLWVYHNGLEYDYPVLNSLVGLNISNIAAVSIDTLIISRLVDYPREGHSIEDYGVEFNLPKGEFNDWTKWSQQMEDYCVRDVEICERIYNKYRSYINNIQHIPSIRLEHQFQLIVNDLHKNGFGFNVDKAQKLLNKVGTELAELDKEILDAFPPTLKLIRQIDPRLTQHGTLHRGDFRWVKDGDLSEFNGGPFCRCGWSAFNPASHKQIIDVLHTAGWRPIDRTATAIDNKRELAKLKRTRTKTEEEKIALDLALKEAYTKEQSQEKYGYKISEQNLLTLPSKDKCLIKIQNDNEITLKNIIKRILNLKDERLLNITIKIRDEPKINNSKEITEYLSKILKECLQNETDVAKFVEKEKSLWLITITPQATYVDFSATYATATSVDLKDIKNKLKNTFYEVPPPARTLARRILVEARRRTLVEWLGLVHEDRIYGEFVGLGAWTHRCAHRNPNTANIPNAVDLNNKVKLYGAEMRSLWCAPNGRLLVGVDAEGIQLRIFAHYIDDPEFTKSLVEGKKDDKTDPHSLNQSILGNVCRSRASAKRFIYALLLGAGHGKLSEILGCSDEQTKQALDRLLARYAGFAELKRTIIPKDARRGWFVGLDGRRVRIPDDDEGSRRHLAMSGYLQNGEKIIIADTAVRFKDWVDANQIDAKLVNIVHDEYIVETPNDHYIANLCKDKLCELIEQVGVDLKLKCPLKGDGSVGLNWYEIH